MEEESRSSRSWNGLEVDCLINILRRLPLDDLAVAVPFVCRSWRLASMDAACWQHLNFQDLSFLPWSHFATRFTAQFLSPSSSLAPPRIFSFTGFMKLAVARSHGSAVELRFPRSFGPSFQDLLFASIECPRLTSIRTPYLSTADEARFPELIGKWTDLEELDIETKPSTFRQLIYDIGRCCRNFTALTMSGSIQDEDARAIVESLPELRVLELSGSFVTKEALMAIMDGCKKLQRLGARDCLGFEADDEVLRKGSDIQHFEYEGSELLDANNGYETDEADRNYGFFLH